MDHTQRAERSGQTGARTLTERKEGRQTEGAQAARTPHTGRHPWEPAEFTTQVAPVGHGRQAPKVHVLRIHGRQNNKGGELQKI